MRAHAVYRQYQTIKATKNERRLQNARQRHDSILSIARPQKSAIVPTFIALVHTMRNLSELKAMNRVTYAHRL